MQIQAGVLGVDVVRPVVAETTALGVATRQAGGGFGQLRPICGPNWREDKQWTPTMGRRQACRRFMAGARRCNRTLDWVGDVLAFLLCA